MKTFGIVSALSSFVLCLAAGLVLLIPGRFDLSGENALSNGLGFYFIGKAIFVGASLLFDVSNKKSVQAD